MKWLPMAFLGLAAGCSWQAVVAILNRQHLSAICSLLMGCFFLLLILAMRALTD